MWPFKVVEWEPAGLCPLIPKRGTLSGIYVWPFPSNGNLSPKSQEIPGNLFQSFFLASMLLVLPQHSTVSRGENWPYIYGSSSFQSVLPAQSSWVSLSPVDLSAWVKAKPQPMSGIPNTLRKESRQQSSTDLGRALPFLPFWPLSSSFLQLFDVFKMCILLLSFLYNYCSGGVACHYLLHLTGKQYVILFASEQIKHHLLSI